MKRNLRSNPAKSQTQTPNANNQAEKPTQPTATSKKTPLQQRHRAHSLPRKLQQSTTTTPKTSNDKMAEGSGEPNLMSFMKSMSADMSMIKESLSGLNTTVDVVRAEIQGIKAQLQEVTTELEAVKNEQKEVKDFAARLSVELNNLKAENLQLKIEANRLDQNDARHKITIHGVPDDGDDMTALCKIARLLEIGLVPMQVADIYRINTKMRDRSRPLVVKFTSKITRDALINNRRKRSIYNTDINLQGEKKQIFLNEYLTKHAMMILNEAKILKKDFSFEFVWPKNGIIYAKKNSDSKVYKITNPEMVNEIVNSINNP
jgi:archaellum component FlaC